jgi:hypothetical protein
MDDDRLHNREQAAKARVKRVHELRVARRKAPRAQRPDRGEQLVVAGRIIIAALSLRVIFAAGFAAILAALLLSAVWQPLFYIGIPVFVLLWLGGTVARLDDRRR